MIFWDIPLRSKKTSKVSSICLSRSWAPLSNKGGSPNYCCYEFGAEYTQGRENKVADALSRKMESQKVGELLAITSPSTTWSDHLKASYAEDLELQQLLRVRLNCIGLLLCLIVLGCYYLNSILFSPVGPAHSSISSHEYL